jgi:hypothetical protein
MRTVVTTRAPSGSLVREAPGIGDGPSARGRYASRSNASSAEKSAALRELIEALAPLGMPELQYAARRSYGGGWVTRIRAATYATIYWLHSTVINVAAVLIIHLAAIKYIFLAVGTV